MNIEDWFQPSQITHLLAYQHLQKTGTWPIGFIPKSVIFTTCWHASLMSILANEYLKIQLEE